MKYNDVPEITIKYTTRGIVKRSIKSPEDVANLLMEMYDADTLEYCETAIVIYLNRANESIGFQKVGFGGIGGVVIDKRVVIGTALKCGASAIILSHNHPSGQLKASEEDKRITNQIKLAGDMLDITLQDHIIITSNGYYSFSEHGIL